MKLLGVIGIITTCSNNACWVHTTFVHRCYCRVFLLVLALDLRNVINELGSTVSKWFQIGIQLGVSETRLHQIEADHRTADRCLSEVIIFWLNGNTNADVSWESLIGALKASVVSEKGLAKSLIQKYGVATSVSKSECLHMHINFHLLCHYSDIYRRCS